MKKRLLLLILTLLLAFSLVGCELVEKLPFLEDLIPSTGEEQLPSNIPEEPDNSYTGDEKPEKPGSDNEGAVTPEQGSPITLDTIPEFDGKTPYVVINGNIPFFTDSLLVETSYEDYSPLDSLGRCGVTIACVGRDIMPTEDRGSIGMVKPSGWQTVKYDIVSGKYLYNRCHLIGYQLTGENANEENLITGTRFMNVDGMLPFEDMVADYVKETGNHVIYRVTPIFKGSELVARGVLMEAVSVEDEGEGIEFCIYVYNNQPGIVINYANGESALDDGQTVFPEEDPESPEAPDTDTEKSTYVLNTSTMKFHTPECHYASSMSEANKEIYVGTAEDLLTAGYDDCGSCKPK